MILIFGWDLRFWFMLNNKEYIWFVFLEFLNFKIGLSCKWKLCFIYRREKLYINNFFGLFYILNIVDDKINSKFNNLLRNNIEVIILKGFGYFIWVI